MPATCSQLDCDRTTVGRGLCSLHYQRARYRGDLDEVAPDGPKPCAQCGTIFEGRRWRSKFCSLKCLERDRYFRRTAEVVRPTPTCLECHATLTGRRDKRFCSPQCAQTWRNRDVSAKAQAARAATLPSCPACGGPLGFKRRTFCSDECKVEARQAHAYGMTVRQFHDLMEQQGRACAICRTTEWGDKGPQIDHCHEGGQVRGVLCVSCNNGLGRFRDDEARLLAAVDYLRRGEPVRAEDQ